MPFKIIRNDIIKVKADVTVNHDDIDVTDSVTIVWAIM